MAAGLVRLGGDELPDFEAFDALPKLDDRAAKLVADDARGSDSSGGPGVPLPDVQVGPAHRGGFELELDLAGARGRFGDIDDLDARLRPDFGDGLHGRKAYLLGRTSRRTKARSVACCGG